MKQAKEIFITQSRKDTKKKVGTSKNLWHLSV
jgi:hypothetical protein